MTEPSGEDDIMIIDQQNSEKMADFSLLHAPLDVDMDFLNDAECNIVSEILNCDDESFLKAAGNQEETSAADSAGKDETKMPENANSGSGSIVLNIKPEPIDVDIDDGMPPESSGGINPCETTNEDWARDKSPDLEENVCLVCRFGGEKFGQIRERSSLTLYESKILRRNKDFEIFFLNQPIVLVKKESKTSLKAIKKELDDEDDLLKNVKNAKNKDSASKNKRIKSESLSDEEKNDKNQSSKFGSDEKSAANQKDKEYEVVKKSALLQYPVPKPASSRPALLNAPPPRGMKKSSKPPLIAASPLPAGANSQKTSSKPPLIATPPPLHVGPALKQAVQKKSFLPNQNLTICNSQTGSAKQKDENTSSRPSSVDSTPVSSTITISSSLTSSENTVKEKSNEKEFAKPMEAASKQTKNAKLQNLSDRLKAAKQPQQSNSKNAESEKTTSNSNQNQSKSGPGEDENGSESTSSTANLVKIPGILDHIPVANLSNFKIKKLDPNAKKLGKKSSNIRASLPKNDEYVSPLDRILNETNKFSKSALFSSSRNLSGSNLAPKNDKKRNLDDNKMSQSMFNNSNSNNRDKERPKFSDLPKIPSNFLDRDNYLKMKLENLNPPNALNDRKTSLSTNNPDDLRINDALRIDFHNDSNDGQGPNSTNSLPSPSGSVSSAGGLLPKQQSTDLSDFHCPPAASPIPPPPPRRISPPPPKRLAQSPPPPSAPVRPTLLGHNPSEAFLSHKSTSSLMNEDLQSLLLAQSSTNSRHNLNDFLDDLLRKTRNSALLGDNLPKPFDTNFMAHSSTMPNPPGPGTVPNFPGSMPNVAGNMPNSSTSSRRITLLQQPPSTSLMASQNAPIGPFNVNRPLRGPKTPPPPATPPADNRNRPVLLPDADPFAFLKGFSGDTSSAATGPFATNRSIGLLGNGVPDVKKEPQESPVQPQPDSTTDIDIKNLLSGKRKESGLRMSDAESYFLASASSGFNEFAEPKKIKEDEDERRPKLGTPSSTVIGSSAIAAPPNDVTTTSSAYNDLATSTTNSSYNERCKTENDGHVTIPSEESRRTNMQVGGPGSAPFQGHPGPSSSASSSSSSLHHPTPQNVDLGKLLDEICDVDESLLQSILMTTIQSMSTPGKGEESPDCQEIIQIQSIFDTLLTERASVLSRDFEKRRRVEALMPVLDEMRGLDSRSILSDLMNPIKEFAQQLIELSFSK